MKHLQYGSYRRDSLLSQFYEVLMSGLRMGPPAKTGNKDRVTGLGSYLSGTKIIKS